MGATDSEQQNLITGENSLFFRFSLILVLFYSYLFISLRDSSFKQRELHLQNTSPAAVHYSVTSTYNPSGDETQENQDAAANKYGWGCLSKAFIGK